MERLCVSVKASLHAMGWGNPTKPSEIRPDRRGKEHHAARDRISHPVPQWESLAYAFFVAGRLTDHINNLAWDTGH